MTTAASNVRVGDTVFVCPQNPKEFNPWRCVKFEIVRDFGGKGILCVEQGKPEEGVVVFWYDLWGVISTDPLLASNTAGLSGMDYWKAIGIRRRIEKEVKASARAKTQAEKKEKERRKLKRMARKNTLWKTEGIDDSRDSYAYRMWRLAVFKRDKFTCQKCRSKKNLVAHHCMERYAQNVKRRLDVNNGVTLCRSCHAEIHPWLKNKEEPTPETDAAV